MSSTLGYEPPPPPTWSPTDYPMRIVGLTFEPPESLLANPHNWRRHPPAQREATREILSRIGWIACVLQNDVTGQLIDGHERIEESISSGQSQVPVLHVELSPEQEQEALIAFDTIALMAERDTSQLDQLIADVQSRLGPAIRAVTDAMLEVQQWPTLQVDMDMDTHEGPVQHGIGTNAEARWVIRFARGAGPDVRDALAALRSKLGPDVNLTWLED